MGANCVSSSNDQGLELNDGDSLTPGQPRPEDKYKDKLHTLQTFAYPGGNVPRPASNKNHLRVYAHPLCPFSARAIYTMSARNMTFQEVFLDLNNLAPWYAPFSTDGCDPTIENASGDMVPGAAIVT